MFRIRRWRSARRAGRRAARRCRDPVMPPGSRHGRAGGRSTRCSMGEASVRSPDSQPAPPLSCTSAAPIASAAVRCARTMHPGSFLWSGLEHAEIGRVLILALRPRAGVLLTRARPRRHRRLARRRGSSGRRAGRRRNRPRRGWRPRGCSGTCPPPRLRVRRRGVSCSEQEGRPARTNDHGCPMSAQSAAADWLVGATAVANTPCLTRETHRLPGVLPARLPVEREGPPRPADQAGPPTSTTRGTPQRDASGTRHSMPRRRRWRWRGNGAR